METKLYDKPLETYKQMLIKERKKIKYIQLRNKIIMYCFEYCVGDYTKKGLSDEEIDCIKNRTYTYLTYYKDFNLNQKENFKGTVE